MTILEIVQGQYPRIIKRGVLCFLSDLKRDLVKDDIDLRINEKNLSDTDIDFKMI